MNNKIRCAWVPSNNAEYQKYHDEEWGVPVHDDLKHFEMLTLEGAQAGLSWETVLKKRDGYRKAFKNFIPEKVALMNDFELENLMFQPEIIRNRLKIFSVRKNAISFLQIQKEFGSFDKYIWSYVNNKVICSHVKNVYEIPSQTEISIKISKNLKKRGMSFVGSTIIYAYMQAIGMVNDHSVDCFRYKELCFLDKK